MDCAIIRVQYSSEYVQANIIADSRASGERRSVAAMHVGNPGRANLGTIDAYAKFRLEVLPSDRSSRASSALSVTARITIS